MKNQGNQGVTAVTAAWSERVTQITGLLVYLPYLIIVCLAAQHPKLHACRQRRTVAGKLWGASMLGVCGGSIVFHTR